jgi:tetratricopeptide (TPR) repeat protein
MRSADRSCMGNVFQQIFKAVLLCSLSVVSACVTRPSQEPDSRVSVETSVSPQSQADYAYTRGEALSQQGQVRSAIEEFRKAKIYDPNSVHLRIRLAKEYVRLAQYTEALKELEEAQALLGPEGTPETYLLKAQILRATDQTFAAIETLERGIKTKEGQQDFDLYLTLGGLYVEEKNWSGAIATLEKSLSLPQAPEEQVHYLLGRCYEEGQVSAEKARQHYEKALQLKPQFAEPLLALTAWDIQHKRVKDATKRLEAWQDRHGPHPKVSETLLTLYIFNNQLEQAREQARVVMAVSDQALEVQSRLALLLIHHKKLKEGAEILEAVLEKAPDSDKLRFILATVYVELGDKEAAMVHYQKVPIYSSYYVDSVTSMTQIYWDQKRWSEAKALLVDVIKKHPHPEEVFYTSLITTLDDLKEHTENQKWLAKARELFPDSTTILFLSGLNWERLGETDKALAEMQEVLKRNPEQALALNFVAYVYAERGEKLDEALALAKKAQQLAPKDPHIQDTLGWVYYRLGQYEESVKWLERAYDRAPEVAVIQEHLGDVYSRMGLLEEAMVWYSMALDFEDDKAKKAQLSVKLGDLRRLVGEKEGSRLPASTSSKKKVKKQ